jgi:hypothetical protein
MPPHPNKMPVKIILSFLVHITFTFHTNGGLKFKSPTAAVALIICDYQHIKQIKPVVQNSSLNESNFLSMIQRFGCQNRLHHENIDLPRNQDLITGQTNKVISTSQRLDRGSTPPPPLPTPNGFHGLFRLEVNRSMKVTTHIHLETRFKMHGAMSPIPMHLHSLVLLKPREDSNPNIHHSHEVERNQRLIKFASFYF